MTSSTRKLIGTILLLVVIFVYFLLAIALGPAVLVPGTPWYGQLVFYAIAGMGWAIPGAVIVKWMAKTDA